MAVDMYFTLFKIANKVINFLSAIRGNLKARIHVRWSFGSVGAFQVVCATRASQDNEQ